MNNLNYQFTMYNLATDTVEVTINTNKLLVIRCDIFNQQVTFESPEDITHLYQLTRDNPSFYAKCALSETGLQDYVNAMNVLN